MSILIPGMEMPTRCITCQMNYDSCACILTGSRFYKYNTEFDPGEERLPDCPLIPVPKHGRLIEESKVLDIVFEWCPDDDGSVGKDGDLREMLDEIEAIPTVIPAGTDINVLGKQEGIV